MYCGGVTDELRLTLWCATDEVVEQGLGLFGVEVVEAI